VRKNRMRPVDSHAAKDRTRRLRHLSRRVKGCRSWREKRVSATAETQRRGRRFLCDS
jgi:hypothetical protein